MHRTQKLLHRDYKSIKDVILLESAFAETTKCGLGVRQVYLALSAHNLFIAADDVGRACTSPNYKERHHSTTVYGKSYGPPDIRRKDFNAIPSSGKRADIREPRNKSKNYAGDSVDPLIESLRLVSMFPLDCVCLHIYRERTRNTIKLYSHQDHTRARYYELGGCGYHGNRAMLWSLWQDRIKALTSSPMENTLSIHSETSVGTSVTKSTLPVYMMARYRRGRTLDSGCTREEVLCDTGHVHYVDSVDVKSRRVSSSEIYRLVEGSVSMWENSSYSVDINDRSRHKKCLPWPHFSYGLGVTSVRHQEKHLLFVRKTKSLPSLDRSEREPELQTSVPNKYLTRTVSQLSLAHPLRVSELPDPVFWTAQFSRATSLRASYHEALRWRNSRNHEMQGDKKPKPGGMWRKFKNITSISKTKLSSSVSTVEEKSGKPPSVSNTTAMSERLSSSIQNMQASYTIARYKLPPDLEHLFRIQHQMHISDCDMEAVAAQLTLIESTLLIAIPVQELVLLANEKCTDNTPHIRHSLAFSLRLSSLVSTEIINTKESVPTRAKILAKFILIAHACSKLHNYQSTLSILQGLQSPPVYRLAQTWSYVRKYHARKYRLFNRMVTILHDPVDKTFVRTMSETIGITQNFVLPLRYVLATLVNRIPSTHGDNMAHAFGTKYTPRVQNIVLQITKPHHPPYGYNVQQCERIERDQSKAKSHHSKSNLTIANYKNISRAIELLVMCSTGAQGYVTMIKSNETLEYLTKRHYTEDSINFILSKKLE